MAVNESTTKYCHKCGETRLASEFSKCVSRPDGLQTHCRKCQTAYHASWLSRNREKRRVQNKSYYVANRERLLEYSVSWQKANPDKVCKYQAKWRAANQEYIDKWNDTNRDRRRKQSAAWYEKNREKVLEYCAKWKAANKDVRRIHARIHAHTRRARKRDAGGKLSNGLAEKLLKLQKGKCACCGKPLGEDYHLDHIMPLALGGTNADNNMQLLRSTCNLQKHAKHPVDFMQERGFLL